MLQKPKNPFQVEIENTQKTIDKKLHFSKNTCKSLISLFENLATIEEQYSKSLKQLLQSGSGAFKISLNQSKENDNEAIKNVIDVFLSGMLQVSEHHGQFKEMIRNHTLVSIKELLGTLREEKKQYLSEIEVNIKKTHDKLVDKIKSEQNSLHNPDKKLNNLFKKASSNEDTESQKQKNSAILQNLEIRKKELEEFETEGKQRLLGIVYKTESIDVYRVNQTKSILLDHTHHLMKMTKGDNDLAVQLFKSYESNTLQIGYDDLSKAKSLIDPNNTHNFQNKQLPTSSTGGGPTKSSNSNGTPTSPEGLNFVPKNDQSPQTPAQSLRVRKQSNSNSPTENQLQKSPARIIEEPTVSSSRLPDFSAFMTRNSMYIDNQPEIYPEFAYNRSLFVESGPYHQDLLTKFDLKYFNSIIYLLLSTYIKLEHYGKRDTSREDLILMVLKNKMKVNLREAKLIDKIFKVQIKNKLLYQQQNMKKNQSIFSIILQRLNKFINKKESKIRDTLAKKEDYDYFLNITKHLLAIIAESSVWEKDSKTKLGFELSAESNIADLKSYEQILAFFFKEKPSDYQNYNLQSELSPILGNQLLQNPNLNITFPINVQVSEALLMSLMDTVEDDKLFIDGWEQNYEIYLHFMKECLGLGDELAALLLLENVFNRYIKPNLVLKEKNVQEYLAAIHDILASLLLKIQNSEFESPTNSARENYHQVLPDSTDFNIQINKFVNYNLSRDIWINCIRLLENLRKMIPPEKHIISGIMQIAYCSFFYQKDNLKSKDFVESIAKALETSGNRISTEFQLKRKKNQTGRSSHTHVMEYTVIFESLEKEIKNGLDSYLSLIIRSLEDIMRKPKEIFEKKLIERFVKGCLDELIADLSKNLALDQDNAELEEDIIVIANQLGNIDIMLHQAGLSNADYADICSVALEKWFMDYTKRARHFASQIMRKEAWQVPDNNQVITNTNIPVDLCYILFNPIEVFKKMAEGSFKDKAIKKFEVTVFEVLSQYLEHLDQSLDPILNNQTPLFFKKVSSSLSKRKTVKINQSEFDELESRQHLEDLRIGVSKLCLRLLNLDFIQREIESSFSNVFGEKSSLIQSLRDFLATFLKRLSKKISKILVMNQFRSHFFKFLYLNLDETSLGTKSTAEFRDEYQFSANNLLHNLVPIMKLLKANVPQYYLPKLLVELLEPFVNEYLMNIVDPEKASRTYHEKYEQFLIAELDNMMEFFFPVNSDVILHQTIKADQISEKFSLIYKVASYFKMDTQKLITELNRLNPLAESDYLKYKAIPRILSLRTDDRAATHFLKHYKEAL